MNVWIQAFIVIAAVAIVIQMAILLAILLSMKGAIEKFSKIADDLTGRIDPILVRTNRILEDSEDKIASIMADGAEVTRMARGQAQKNRPRVYGFAGASARSGDPPGSNPQRRTRGDRRHRDESSQHAVGTCAPGFRGAEGREGWN